MRQFIFNKDRSSCRRCCIFAGLKSTAFILVLYFLCGLQANASTDLLCVKRPDCHAMSFTGDIFPGPRKFKKPRRLPTPKNPVITRRVYKSRFKPDFKRNHIQPIRIYPPASAVLDTNRIRPRNKWNGTGKRTKQAESVKTTFDSKLNALQQACTEPFLQKFVSADLNSLPRFSFNSEPIAETYAFTSKGCLNWSLSEINATASRPSGGEATFDVITCRDQAISQKDAPMPEGRQVSNSQRGRIFSSFLVQDKKMENASPDVAEPGEQLRLSDGLFDDMRDYIFRNILKISEEEDNVIFVYVIFYEENFCMSA